jgi:gamma-glutamyltranspeptidase/glutathione hydrolase
MKKTAVVLQFQRVNYCLCPTEIITLSKPLGIAATGHVETSEAARIILSEGGNAFDAVIGAMCAACVCEPMLSSLGGGGFLLAQPVDQAPEIFDFFVQTPSVKKGDIDFYPIHADFGPAVQEFHIGMGSIAVPGVVAGIYAVHESLCSMPLEKIVEPAVRLAREGVQVNEMQKSTFHVLTPINTANAEAFKLVRCKDAPERVAELGEFTSNPELADTLEALARHDSHWFYQGEPGQQLVRDCREHGGLVTMADMQAYEVIRRQPLFVESHGAQIAVNCPPSPGGCLTLFALSLLDDLNPGAHPWGSTEHVMELGRVMQTASLTRKQNKMSSGLSDEIARQILSEDSLAHWHNLLQTSALATRGTTHLSVADAAGNLASLTLSNGEGSSYVLPGSGMMLNNMMGEEDLSPDGFHRMPAGVRLASMMTPTIANLSDGSQLALGSGGSNRIRSAILQVLTNMFEFGMPLGQAVAAPRMHLEGPKMSLEPGYSDAAIAALAHVWPELKQWPKQNLFFGGVHAVQRFSNGEFVGMGDPRRGGAVAIAL